MPLTDAMLSALLIERLGTDFGPEAVALLRPLAEQQLRREREARDLDLGDDPRTMAYIKDRRIAP